MVKHDLICKDCHVKLGEATFEREPDPKTLQGLLNRQRCAACQAKVPVKEGP